MILYKEAVICGPIFVCKVDDVGRSIGLSEAEAHLVIALLKVSDIHRKPREWF